MEADHLHPQLTEELDWFFLAVANPDGYQHSRGGDRLWRKTRSDNRCGAAENGTNAACRCGRGPKQGADLNRNWSHHWREAGAPEYPNPCASDFEGTEPFSEVKLSVLKLGRTLNYIKGGEQKCEGLPSKT